MNANRFHNILNIAGSLFAILLLADWQAMGFTAEQSLMIAAWVLLGDKSVKLAMNYFRDGPDGMWAEQPPVKKRK
jgi:hypothetical protein